MTGEAVPSALKMAVGRRLLATRVVVGRLMRQPVTADMMANMLGVGRTAYTNWEIGENLASVPAMIRLCDKFGFTLDWIYAGRIGTLRLDLIPAVETAAAEVEAVVGGPLEETQYAASRSRGDLLPRPAATVPRRRRSKVTIHELAAPSPAFGGEPDE